MKASAKIDVYTNLNDTFFSIEEQMEVFFLGCKASPHERAVGSRTPVKKKNAEL